jgi:glycosyltransferase involved in cell wall biosynthesis
VPLAVYSGVVKAARGVATIVRALPLLPDLHLAVVARTPYTADVKELVAEAACLGCDDRVRLVPYVEHDEVSGYLASADVGIHPLLRSGNAELALPNKLFEYLHAGLPMVVSDMPSMSQLVIERGWGEVFVADDHEDLARVLRRVLAHPSFYAAGLQDSDARTWFSWERQARTLIETYDRLLGGKDASASPRAVGSA